ncbi:MAG: hypothetical protein IPF81_15970 [Bacteroidetes bacterium]|nr:hypothetical protein [Bacteroidota bacterium]
MEFIKQAIIGNACSSITEIASVKDIQLAEINLLSMAILSLARREFETHLLPSVHGFPPLKAQCGV